MKPLVPIALMIFMLFFRPLLAFVDTEVSSSAQHAHIASPEQYSLLLENDQVYVLKMTLKPGEQDNWHRHNAETVYFEKGGRATISVGEDQMTVDIPDGHVMWHDAWEHQVKNDGDTTIIAIIVEEK